MRGIGWRLERLLAVAACVTLLSTCRSPDATPARPESVRVTVDADQPSDGGADVPPIEDGISADERLCESACATTADIQCADRMGPTVCVRRCLQALTPNSICPDFARAVNSCFVVSGPLAFTCNVTAGATILKPGYCVQELTAFSSCAAHY